MAAILVRSGLIAFALTTRFAAIACSCSAPPPPCEAYWRTEMIFLATVTEALESRGGQITRARVQVDKAYKGVHQKTLILFDSGMCDGPELRVAEQYLMYTDNSIKGEVPSRGCTRSRNVKEAAEDLRYLNSVSESAPLGSVFGTAVVLDDDFDGTTHFATGAVIKLDGAGRTHIALADAEGRYSFLNLEPAEYSLSASYPGFRTLPDEGQQPLLRRIPSRGCASVNLVFRKDWKGVVTGRLVRPGGTSAPSGIYVSLIRLWDRDGAVAEGLDQPVRTNERGEFTFLQVAAGRYKLAINNHRFPTRGAPYPTIYWPGVRETSSAQIIDVPDEVTDRRYDFRLPSEPESRIVTGIVVTAGGNPVAGAQVSIEALPDSYLAGNDENRVESDAEGRFSFTALAGFDYRVIARTFDGSSSGYAERGFSLKQGADTIQLVLEGEQDRKANQQ